jgi:glycosyltransferase involved in cell wall biosynthesis
MNERPHLPSLSCVVPAYNEAVNLPDVLAHVLSVLRPLSCELELVVVDDGSKDDTPEVMQALCQQHPELVYLRLSRNFGKEAALTAGLDATRGQVVVLLDADGQHPPEMIPSMLAQWRAGFDVVYAVRRSRNDQTRLHANLTGWFYKAINWRSRVTIPAHAGDFRLMDRQVVEALKLLPERNRFMKGLYAWVGFASTAMEYDPLPRLRGESHFRLRASFSLALTGMLSFSTAPLRLLSYIGVVISALAMGYGFWVVGEHFVVGTTIPGYATIVAGMMLLSGIQLLSIGVLAEYVGRIYDEVKQRPTYLVSRQLGHGLAKVKARALPSALSDDAGSEAQAEAAQQP